MKKMGKAAAAVILSAVMTFALAACNKNEATSDAGESFRAEGTWKQTLVEDNEQAAAFYDSVSETRIVFQENGTLTFQVTKQGKTTSHDGTWKQNGDRVTITDPEADGDKQEKTYLYQDGKLLEQDNPQSIFCFKKE